MNRLNRYLIAGILMVAPLAITIYIGYQIVIRLDAQMHRLLPDPYSSVPGMGIVVLVVALIFIGFITTGVIGRLVNRSIDLMLALVPVPMVRSVYGTLRQMLEQIFSSNSSAFREVVMVEYPRKGIFAIGFLSGESYEACQVVHGMRLFNVFVPTTPNPTSGFLLLVPETEIFRTKLSVEEGIKLVVSSGIVHPDIDSNQETRSTERSSLAGQARPFASASQAQDARTRGSKRVDGRLTVIANPPGQTANLSAKTPASPPATAPAKEAAKEVAKEVTKAARPSRSAEPLAKTAAREATATFRSQPSSGILAQSPPVGAQAGLGTAKARSSKAMASSRPKLASRKAKGSNAALRSS